LRRLGLIQRQGFVFFRGWLSGFRPSALERLKPVIASEAKESISVRSRRLDRFVASLLAMTRFVASLLAMTRFVASLLAMAGWFDPNAVLP
jgi:hypothetical protein